MAQGDSEAGNRTISIGRAMGRGTDGVRYQRMDTRHIPCDSYSFPFVDCLLVRLPFDSSPIHLVVSS